MRSHTSALLFLFSLCALVHAQNDSAIPAREWWSHVAYLADDKLRGRETGSEGDHQAAEYIASIFRRAGLSPGGTQGFVQPVRLRARRVVEEQSSMSLVRNGATEPVVLGEEATFNMRIEPAAHVDAPIVFAGYGLTVPEMRYDDLSGLDLRGKIVMLLTGGPTEIPAPLLSHYQTERWEFLRRAGAIGVIQIQNPRKLEIPWTRSMLRRLMPQMTLEDRSLDETAGEQLAVMVNPTHAEKFFAGSGHSFQEILALADSGMPLPRFTLPATLSATVKTESWPVESENIVGILPGTDPKLKNEYLILSAHFDHLGVGEPIHGDGIYNGAMDNAAGIATMLETASKLHDQKKRFRRSVVFLAVTAEEKGLLGSKYFAAHPTMPAAEIVAEVNVDMFLPLFPLQKLMVQGLDESDLAADVQSAVGSMGIAVVPDLELERDSYTRSDQYSFVKRGVPAIALKVGYLKGSPEQEIVRRWRSERYHGPTDDLQQPIDFQAAADFNRVYLRIVETIANRATRPSWNPGSFFRRFAH